MTDKFLGLLPPPFGDPGLHCPHNLRWKS